jgi:hypothetical protein
MPKPKGGRGLGESATRNSVKRQEKLHFDSYWKKSRQKVSEDGEQSQGTEDELMHQRRKRIPASVNAALFAVSFFALAMIFANDWMEMNRTVPKIAGAAPIENKNVEAQTVEPAPVAEEAKPPEERPAKEEAPAVAAAEEPALEKPPGEDPWAAEKARVEEKNRRQRAGMIRVNPRVLLDAQAFAIPDFGPRGPQFAIPDIHKLVPPMALGDEFRGLRMGPMLDPEKAAEEFFATVTARRVASEVQMLFFTSAPICRRIVSRFDVTPSDGRLVVHVRDAFFDLEADDRRKVMDSIAKVWRDTKYTTTHKCSKAVEFRSTDGWKETQR